MNTPCMRPPAFEKWAFVRPGGSALWNEYHAGILDFIKDHPNIILDVITHRERGLRRFSDITGFITYGIPPKDLIAKVTAQNGRPPPAIAVSMCAKAPDNFAIARINPLLIAERVVEKLRQRHCRSFCFCSAHTPFLADETACLLRAYRQTVFRTTGRNTRLFRTVMTTDVNLLPWEADRFAQWFHDLPRPCGMFVHGDDVARMMINMCRLRGIDVPADIRIIGTGNSSLICDRTIPTLSSYAVNHERVGFLAAQALYAMIHDGVSPQEASFAVSTPGVVERASTYDDKGAGRIVELVLSHLHDALDRGFAPSIRDIAHRFDISRTKLQDDFSRTTGHTLHQEVSDYRLNRLAALLKASNEPVKLLFARVGFRSASQAKRAFKARFGMTMTEYRGQK